MAMASALSCLTGTAVAAGQPAPRAPRSTRRAATVVRAHLCTRRCFFIQAEKWRRACVAPVQVWVTNATPALSAQTPER